VQHTESLSKAGTVSTEGKRGLSVALTLLQRKKAAWEEFSQTEKKGKSGKLKNASRQKRAAAT